ncbi:diadenylate cyclase CdaA [Geotalea sp. SG265]|uniref:diadenylate cyclase CdaA n=1 Tax=Geotalea sp. SG265 TaxID=2922867 RepID=UPI001FAF0365|nr:diadenylate cyclase CdaA [Geotalea sp. SG265]
MFSYFRPQDIADILIMSFLVYQLYSWFKNTRALQVVMGLGFLGLLYVITKNLGLFMTSWILQELGTVLFILLIVIFQSEIRQALYRFSLLRNLFGRQDSPSQLDLMDIASTIFALAQEKTGALIVFQRRESLDDYLLHGIQLDSLPSNQLLNSIFKDGAPLHDGAVIIRDGRIAQASCHLPLSSSTEIPQYFGTRHRAGVGLTERSDAAVVIVSEERGTVFLALAGELSRIHSPEELYDTLNALLSPPVQEVSTMTLRRTVFGNMGPKLAIVLFVLACWLLITSRQGAILTVNAPVKFHSLPKELSLIKTTPEEVEVQLKVFSNLIPSPKEMDIIADVDLSRIKEGVNNIAIRSEEIKLPPGVIIAGVSRSTIRVVADRKVVRHMTVKAGTVSRLPGKLRLRAARVEPPTVVVEGPAHVINQFDQVQTEEIDLSTIRQNSVVERRVLSPSPQLRVLRDEPVTVRLLTGG